MRRVYFLLVFVFCACFALSANAHKPLHKVAITGHSIQHNQLMHFAGGDTAVHYKRKHKLWAFILALPPFSLIGLHRIYLGTSAAIPFLYIASVGGCLGILPFVVFALLILCTDVNAYAHSPSIFMWSKRKKG